MASKRQSYQIVLSAKDKGLTAAFKRASLGLKAFRTELMGSRKVMSSMGRDMLSLAGVAGTTYTAFQLVGLADQYTTIDAKLKLVTSSAEDFKAVQEGLYKLSQNTGTSYTQNAAAYSKLALSLKSVGASSQEMLNISDLVNKSLAVSGASAEETSSFMLQFAQAMGSGVLQGDEFRAMMEANSYFGAQLATALDTDIAGLRAMSKEGKLTTDLLRSVFPQMADEINTAFEQMPLTISRATAMIKNAFGKVLNESNQATSGTRSMAEAMKELVGVIEQNGPAIREMAVGLAQLVKVTAKWVIEHREGLATTLKITAALYLSGKAIGLVVRAWNGFTSAMMVAFRFNVVAWLKNLSTAATAAATGTTALATAFRVSLALAAAQGAVNIYRLIQLVREHIKVMKEQAEMEKHLGTLQGKLAAKIGEISKQTGVAMKSQQDFNKAIKDGKIIWDEASKKWVSAHQAAATAATKSASTQQRVTGDALKKMEQQYEAYADKVKSIQDEIKNREKSLEEQLREMSRSGMSDFDAWQDRKKEAEEYMAAAEAAAKAGDWDEAKANADKAKAAYAELNTEVKDGDQVQISKTDALKTAMTGVKSAGNLAIDILKQQKTATEEAMDALVEKSGFQDLGKHMDASKKKWLDNWSKMRSGATAELDKVSDYIDKIVYDREMNFYYNVKEKKALGGLIGTYARMARGGWVNYTGGGKLPGYGGGDRRQILAEDGEVMIRKESVRKAGLKAALAFNAGRFDLVMAELSKRFSRENLQMRLGGMVAALPALPPMPMATGGPVAAAAGPSGLVAIDMRVTNDRPVRLYGTKDAIAEMQRQKKRMAKYGS